MSDAQPTGLQVAFDQRVVKACQTILGDEKTASRFLRGAWYAAQSVTGLQACTAPSIAVALIQAAQLRLEIGTALGEAWILPYGAGPEDEDEATPRGRVKRAQLQVGYRGWQTLHRRCGVRDLHVNLVYEDELGTFQLRGGDRPGVDHVRALTSREGVPVVGGYSIGWIGDSAVPAVFWMTLADIEKRRAASKSYQGAMRRGTQASPWLAYPETMLRKTVLKGHSPWLPASEEVSAALEIDNRAEGIESRPNLLLDQSVGSDLAREFAEQEQGTRERIKADLERRRTARADASPAEA